MTAFAQVALALTPLAFAAALIAVLAWAVTGILADAERERRFRLTLALAETDADWRPDALAAAAWDQHTADALALCEAPIFDRLHRDRFEADALAEIERLTGGAV